MKLENKVAIVTGAAVGIGRAIAALFAQEGAKVVLADINAAELKKAVAEIESNGGTATGVVIDMSQEADIEKMIAVTLETYNGLDILVNNAGIMDNFLAVTNLTNEVWERVMAINLTGPFKAARLAIPHMVKQAGGVVINISSVGGLFGTRGGAAYVSSKHGLIGLTKNIASTYAKQGIRCNVIAPGGVETNIGSTITAPDPIGMEAMTKGTGEAAMGKPINIAQTALFLASADSEFVNGATIVVDGGWTAF